MLRLPPPTEDTPTFDEIDRALSRLDPQAAPRWGEMKAGQMVRHCAAFCDLYLGRVSVPMPIRAIARMIGPLFLRRVVKGSPTATPKNLKTLPSLRTGSEEALDLGAEVEVLRERLRAVGELEGVVQHVLYGPTEAEAVRTLVRHHTAHHLNQFGILDPGV
ncbi:MAG: hypothetical protein AAF726_07520 [Planctomycetota bacterium]